MLDHLTVVDHPLVQHKLTIMRDKNTSTAGFRRLLREISLLLAYEITRELDMTTVRIETPIEPMDAPTLDGKKLALISILRAGNGLMDGILELIPAARVGFVGSRARPRRGGGRSRLGGTVDPPPDPVPPAPGRGGTGTGRPPPGPGPD